MLEIARAVNRSSLELVGEGVFNAPAPALNSGEAGPGPPYLPSGPPQSEAFFASWPLKAEAPSYFSLSRAQPSSRTRSADNDDDVSNTITRTHIRSQTRLHIRKWYAALYRHPYTQYLANQDRVDGSLPFPVAASRHPPRHLYEHLFARHGTHLYQQSQGRVGYSAHVIVSTEPNANVCMRRQYNGHGLEGSEDRRQTESIHKSVLYIHGGTWHDLAEVTRTRGYHDPVLTYALLGFHVDGQLKIEDETKRRNHHLRNGLSDHACG